jgi:hypothetical protein
MELIAGANLPRTTVLKNTSEIEEGCRLFYEYGYYSKSLPVLSDWVHTGKFIEIKEPLDFKKHLELEEKQKRFKEYLKHHNFRIWKKKKKIIVE